MHAFTALIPGTALKGYNEVEAVEEDAPIIAISFKGTQRTSLKNWIENLKLVRSAREMSCAGCAVHSGFVELWDSVSAPLVADVRRLLEAHPRARIVITGHSMGGAVAVVAAYVLQHDFAIPVSGPVFTYGGPRVGNAAFAAQFAPGASSWSSASPTVWRLTHNRDPIPHLPLEVMGFEHVGSEVFYDEGWGTHRLCGGFGESAKCANSIWLWESVEDHINYFAEEVGVCN